jgi:hypothetical protein
MSFLLALGSRTRMSKNGFINDRHEKKSFQGANTIRLRTSKKDT